MTKVVLIEDNTEVRENTAEILELAGYNVSTADNGRAGVELIREVKPDLIICDIMMPELDGYGVLHILSKTPETSTIPFIFLTAKTEKVDLRKGMNMGADDYLTKPFEETELLDAIESRLKKNEILQKEYSRDAQGLNNFLKEARKLEDLQKLSEGGNTRHYKKKDYVFLKGSPAQMLYFVNSGVIKTYRSNEYGKELTTAIHKKGDFIGYNALLMNSTYDEAAVAMEDSELSLIPRADFFALLYNNREVSKKFIRMLSEDLTNREEKMIRMAYSSVRRRVADGLLELNTRFNEKQEEHFTMKVSRENLASIAGTTTETLIRTLRDFKDEGLIDIQGRELTIMELKKLRKLPD